MKDENDINDEFMENLGERIEKDYGRKVLSINLLAETAELAPEYDDGLCHGVDCDEDVCKCHTQSTISISEYLNGKNFLS
jgi:hypothetical protein